MKTVKNVKLNLLPDAVRLELRSAKYKKINSVAMFVLAIVWIVVSAIVMILGYTQSNRLEAAKVAHSRAETQLKTQSETMQTIADIKFASKLANDILDNRFEYARAYRLVRDVFPSGIVLEEVLLKQPKVFIIHASAPTNQYMADYEQLLADISAGKKNDFLSMKLDSIGRSKNGWLFDMEVRLK